MLARCDRGETTDTQSPNLTPSFKQLLAKLGRCVCVCVDVYMVVALVVDNGTSSVKQSLPSPCRCWMRPCDVPSASRCPAPSHAPCSSCSVQ